MIVYETSRLMLATWELEDFDSFAPIARNPDVMRYIAEGEPWPDSRIGWFLGKQNALQETLGYCNWKLIDRTKHEIVGFCGLAPLRSVGEIEIGWWLRPDYWHRGLACEAAEKVVEVAFAEHQLPRLVARAYQANACSIKIMERLGMTFDHVMDAGAMGDIVLYKKENT